VYEVHARAWLRTLAGRAGVASLDLGHVPDSALEELSRRGFTHLWLMGVWSIGPDARRHACRLAREGRLRDGSISVSKADVCGSPYAIQAYEVPVSLGGEPGLARLRDRLHRHGLRLILDFVPNHVALDHPWVTRHPECFVQARHPAEGYYPAATVHGRRWIAHGRDPYFPPWTDTAQLDWRRAEVRERMGRVLEGIADRCDGIRVDMAMLILPGVFRRQWGPGDDGAGVAVGDSFWPGALRAIRSRHPGFLCLAEAYWDRESELLAEGFDFAYDKRFYDHLTAHRLPELVRHLEGGREAGGLWARGARFLENHDEPRVRSLCSDADQGAWVVLLLGLPGLRLIHEGQMQGARRPHDIRCVSVIHEEPDRALLGWYETCLGVVRRLGLPGGEAHWVPALPAWEDNPSHGGFVAVLWMEDHRRPRALVVVNVARHRAQCRLELGPLGVAASGWQLKEAVVGGLHGGEMDWSSEGVLTCDLDGPAGWIGEFAPR
jgi:hypothetical protein